MTPERWRRIEELYHAAHDRPAGERPVFLAGACGQDEGLRRDVEALLDESSRDGILAAPVLGIAGHLAADVPAALQSMVGQSIAGYELHALLGAGGMGEVYRSHDAQLGRDVAIKILPRAFTSHPDRLARFEREARMLAALNHPNVCAIYGLADDDGLRCLILELVEGETLDARIASPARKRPAGPGLPLTEALTVARQIAEGLEVAHDKGIIHRDLKPANIKITPEGVVKILDFGLAKATVADDSTPFLTHVPDATEGGRRAGAVIGTAAYMSPEQARGLVVDKRTDIWTFGCVLYEMLTGRATFPGDTISDSIAKILEREPDWSLLPAATPAGIRRLLGRCLEKDPKHRLKDIGDARIEMDDVDAGTTREPLAPSARRGGLWRRALPWGVAVMAIAVAGLAAWNAARQRPAALPPTVRFEIDVPVVESAALSPDGSRLVIADGEGALAIRPLDRIELRRLAGTEGAVKPSWSPDGLHLVYRAAGKVWRVAATGATPTQICADRVAASRLRARAESRSPTPSQSDTNSGTAWLADGTIIFSTGASALMQVPAEGGDPVVAVALDATKEMDFHDPTALPDGRGVVFVTHRKPDAIDTLELWANGRRTVLLQMEGDVLQNPVYSATGHILFERGAAVWALPFSLDRLSPTGVPFLVAENGRAPTAAANGTILYVPRRPASRGRLTWLDRKGAVQGRIGEPREFGSMAKPALSPDGNRLVVAEENGTSDLWQYDLTRGTHVRLTSEGDAREAVFTPDGGSVVFESRALGAPSQLRRVAVDGPGTSENLGAGSSPAVAPGGQLLFTDVSPDGNYDIFQRPLHSAGSARVVVDRPDADFGARVAPDGTLVAFMSREGSEKNVFVARFPSGGERRQVSEDGGSWPRWSRDGRTLFYANRDDIFEVTVGDGREIRLGVPRRLFSRRSRARLKDGDAPSFEVSQHGAERFLVVEPEGAEPVSESMVIVLNWVPEVVGTQRATP